LVDEPEYPVASRFQELPQPAGLLKAVNREPGLDAATEFPQQFVAPEPQSGPHLEQKMERKAAQAELQDVSESEQAHPKQVHSV
jgi:hypothetical protein